MPSFQPTHKITTDRETIEVMLVDEGAAYTEAEWECIGTADFELNSAGEWTFQGQPFSGRVEKLGCQYKVAFVLQSTGGWDVVETFTAADDAAANAYAEQHYADREWYVLDADGENINA
jgi:hypothetical protein